MAAFPGTLEDRVNAVVNPIHTGSSFFLLARTNTAPRRLTASSANNNGLQIGKIPERQIQNEPNVVSFGSSNSGLQAGIINGDIHGITFNYSENLSMFGSLAEGTHLLDTSILDILARRAQNQAGRKVSVDLPNKSFNVEILTTLVAQTATRQMLRPIRDRKEPKGEAEASPACQNSPVPRSRLCRIFPSCCTLVREAACSETTARCTQDHLQDAEKTKRPCFSRCWRPRPLLRAGRKNLG